MELTIGLSDRCNLKCDICESRQNAAFNRPDMPFDKYLQLLDQLPKTRVLGEKITTLRLDGNRESLLYPRLQDAISAAKGQGLETYLITNGIALSAEMSQKLIDAGLDRIIISITGISPEIYAKFQGCNMDADVQLRRVQGNVKVLVETRNRAKSPLHITISYILGLGSHSEARQALFFWKGAGVDAVQFTSFIKTRPVENSTCHPINTCFRTITISSVGDVVPCCMTNECQILGNCFDRPLYEILGAEKTVQFMHTLAKFDFLNMDESSRCPYCNAIRTFPGERRFPG